MTDDHCEHACPGCNHSQRSVEALQARLTELDSVGGDDEASLEVWSEYFEEVCRLVADVTCLDLDAVTTILEGLMVLDGTARAKGAAAVTASKGRRRSRQKRSPDRCGHAAPPDDPRRGAGIVAYRSVRPGT